MILTLLTSILWVSLNVYRSFTVKPDTTVPAKISEPLTPSLDQNAILKIESKIFFDSSQIPDSVAVETSEPSPTVEPVATTEPTTTPEVTPEASSSATPEQQ